MNPDERQPGRLVQRELNFDVPSDQDARTGPSKDESAQSSARDAGQAPQQPEQPPALERTTVSERALQAANPLPGIVNAKAFFQVLQSSNIYCNLRVALLPPQQSRLSTAIAQFQRLRGEVPRRDSWSFENERSAFDTLIRLATTLGPPAILHHVSTQYARARKNEAKQYAQRMFRYPTGGTEGCRSVLPIVESLFIENGEKIHLRARADAQQAKQSHSRLAEDLAEGAIAGPIHTKEAVVKETLAQSPHVQNGGRVLIICDDAQTRKYLALKSKEWGPVAFCSHTLASPRVRESLTSPENAYSTKDGSLEVFVLKPAQLERKNLGGSYAVHAALTIVYNVGVNARTGQPDLHPEKQVAIRTKQAIELSLNRQVVQDKQQLLSLQQAVNDRGEIAEVPDAYWEK